MPDFGPSMGSSAAGYYVSESLSMHTILILNGPNLNMLGTRETGIYGARSLADVNAHLQQTADNLGVALVLFQSNAEHELLRRIHATARDETDFALVNAGAFTHTSIALRDALLAVQLPFIEVHISNIHAREDFRRRSYLSDIAVGVVSGLGVMGYDLSLRAAVEWLRKDG